MIHHTSPISGIATYHNKYIATTGYDNQVILWDQVTHQPVARGTHDHLANFCRFSTCGSYLLSAGSDHLARLWKLPEMKLLTIYTGHKDDVEKIAISTDNKWVATASRDRMVRLFDLEGNLHATLSGHTADVLSVEFNLENDELITSGDDATVRVWDCKEKKQKNVFSFNDIETDTVCIMDEIIYAGNDQGEIIVIKNGKITHTIEAHQVGIKSLVSNKDHNILLSSSYDYTVSLWAPDETLGLTLLETIPCPLIVWLRAATIVNEHLLAFGTFGDRYCLYNRVTKEWSIDQVLPTYGKNAVAVLKDGDTCSVGDAGIIQRTEKPPVQVNGLCNFFGVADDMVIAGGQSGDIYDAATGRSIYKHYSPLNCAASFMHQGHLCMAVGTYTGEAVILRKTGGELHYFATIPLHANAIKGLAANSELLFSVCATGAAAFHRLDDFSLHTLHKEGHDKIANGAAALPDGRFVSISRDLHLRIWTGDGALEEVVPTLHHHSIKCVATGGEDGYMVAIGSYSGHTSVYNTRTKQWISHDRPTSSGISCICYHPGKKVFLASSYDGNIYELKSA